ncbi:hypothetical protein KIPB_006610 [Kipferlia bialata]|uniref:Uncharacterized protein n=1 Tax=Kipferlia bialata TaxID=797122 RepID=A0A9K3CX94_9EUKA|nr:hypothetical protein KIPB_006610 [Kipferlia bialata]|eukprot:g6610.t1
MHIPQLQRVCLCILTVLVCMSCSACLCQARPTKAQAGMVVDAEAIRASVAMGEAYLEAAVKEDGSFVYLYDPETQQEVDDYNVVRHAGTVWSMARALRYLDTSSDGSPALAWHERADAMHRAADKMLDWMVPCVPGIDTALCMRNSKWVSKLGGNALALLALSEIGLLHLESPHLSDTTSVQYGVAHYTPYMHGLAAGILGCMDGQGGWDHHNFDCRKGTTKSGKCSFFAGEAALALCRYHSYSGDTDALEGAREAVTRIVADQDAALEASREKKEAEGVTPKYTMDHWVCIAMSYLNGVEPLPSYLTDHLREQAVLMQRGQRTSGRYLGGYQKPPAVCSSATRFEALVGAYSVLCADQTHTAGSAALCTGIRQTLARGSHFLVSSQYPAPRSVHTESTLVGALPPQDGQAFSAVGGWPSKQNDRQIRIDNVQHSMCALMGMAVLA